MPRRDGSQADAAPASKADLAEFERFLKTFMNTVASQRADYLHDMDAIGWGKILDPERLKADTTLNESKMIIKDARQIVAKYRAKTALLLDKFSEDVRNLNVSESAKESVLSGFEKGMSKSGSQIDAVWNYESQEVDEAEQIIMLLSRARGKWTVQNRHILFENEGDLQEFNRHVKSISEIAQKKTNLRSRESN